MSAGGVAGAVEAVVGAGDAGIVGCEVECTVAGEAVGG